MSEVKNGAAANPAARRYPKGFAWFAAGAMALAAALCVPTARDVIHTQVYALAGMASAAPSLFKDGEERQKETERRQWAEAARHPDDVAMQVSMALPRTLPSYTTGANETSLRESMGEAARLNDLGEKFPNSAIPQAAILRRLTETAVAANRPEGDLLSPPSKQPKPGAVKEKSRFTDTLEALTLFGAAAARGAEIEQDNAFFPTMQAMGLLALHQDADAIAYLRRAANAPKWDEHIADVTDGRLRLIDGVNGLKTPVIASMAVFASELYPQYAGLRQMARTMTALAVQKELAGDKSGGLQIRMDLARVGAKMRVESRTLIGSLVGIAVTAISGSRPGGMPANEGMSTDERTAKNLTDYIAYLKSNGYDKEAVWYTAERQKGNEVKTATHGGMEQGLFGMRWVAPNVIGWAVGWLMLFNLMIAILVGAISAALLRRLANGAKIPWWAWAAGGCIALTLLSFGAYIGSSYMSQATAFLGGPSSDDNSARLSQFFGLLVAGGFLFGGVLVGGIVYAVRAKRGGQSVSLGVLRGYREDTLKSIGACLLIYAAAAMFTGWHEATISAEHAAMRQHEGRYLASVTNAKWPEAVAVGTHQSGRN